MGYYLKISDNNLVSIIMPTYNNAMVICDSIKSVQEQIYSDWELIIIDDCSTDNTESIINENNDPRIHYFKMNQNQGVAKARNRGIQKAEGRYLAFLDSDDLWLPEKLLRQIQFMQKHHYVFSYTWYKKFRKDATFPGRLIKSPKFVGYKDLLHGNSIGCLTVVLDRLEIPHIEMPNEYHEDYITWLNILKTGIIAHSLPIDLARYRISTKSLSGNKLKSFLWTWRVYRNSQQLGVWKACCCMVYYIIYGIKKHYF